MTTPYINTTGRCVELLYRIYGNVDSIEPEVEDTTGVKVVAIDEELNENVVWSVSGDCVDYRRIFAPLPAGIHRVAVDGRRNNNYAGTRTVSVDNLKIAECSQFGK